MVERCFRDGSIDKRNVHDDVLVVGVPTRITTVQKRVCFFNGKEPNRSINSDVGSSQSAGFG